MKPTTLGLFTYPWASECPDVKNYKWRLNPVWHRMLYSCIRMATVGVKGLNWARFMYHSRVSVLYIRRSGQRVVIKLAKQIDTLTSTLDVVWTEPSVVPVWECPGWTHRRDRRPTMNTSESLICLSPALTCQSNSHVTVNRSTTRLSSLLPAKTYQGFKGVFRGATVWASDLRSSGRGFDSRPGHHRGT